ncbi:MAG: hypothetical protein PHT44_02225 [Candidatus Portnoybacteria bacterium]|nr:hypothetical protein [Candidatus Portnoybacteria bacterium]MDD4982357.1 hypothetical protein [Candidatus Portnoybacteria bacterium]
MCKIISKFVFYTIVFAGALGVSILGVNELNLVLAQDLNDSGISYPVKELGGCADKNDCKKYCDIKGNQTACLNFAQSHNMMSKQDIDKAKKVLQLAEQGTNTPGNCKGEEQCDVYCNDAAHLDECVAFGEAAGIMTKEEARMIKKTGGKGPGGCQGKKACDAYCENDANLNECISFAEQNGMMSAQEKEMIKKTGGKGPGGCKSKETCDAYCQQKENFDTCLEFGHQNGMMNDEEYAMAKKVGPRMMNQGGPGGCKDKASCDVFCGDEKNFDTCLEFGKQNGMMSEEEYAQAKKMGPKMMSQGGPGGCKGKDECEAFCENPANGEGCLKFAIANGMMSEEEASKMKERGFMAPPKDALGANGEFMGPGGCKSQEECTAFCFDKTNANVCAMFGAGRPPGQGGDRPIMPGTETGREGGSQQAGPGGCDSPTACMKFCSDLANQDTCARFTAPPPPGQGDPNQSMAPGSFQVPRREEGQQQPPPPGENGSGQGMGLPGEEREGMAPGTYQVPRIEVEQNQQPGGQSAEEYNQINSGNTLNGELPIRPPQPMQPPVGEPGQQSSGSVSAPPAGQSAPMPQAPPTEFQAPAPVAPPPSAPAPSPQASKGGGLIGAIANFFASVFGE